VVPKISVLAEFPVAVVEKVVSEKGTTQIAQDYLNYLYSAEAQEVLAGFYYRVHHEKVAAAHAAQFPALKLVAVESIFGDWDRINQQHFATGATLDQLLRQISK
jgi:sulfate transport system substrate-binding protein